MTTDTNNDAKKVEDTNTSIVSWFKKAVPSPNESNMQSQLGCHLEEVMEMLQAIFLDYSDNKRSNNYLAIQATIRDLKIVSDGFKNGNIQVDWEKTKNTDLLDSIADQQVTGIGLAYMLGMDSVSALAEVNKSNWSKFDENGNPIFDDNKKIMKGKNYKAPYLVPFLGKKVG